MTIPIWMLFGFAMWTLTVLLGSVGVYRWSRILTGKVAIKEFRADKVEGDDWYLRAMRAHANCIENLPVFAVIVFVSFVSGASSANLDIMAVGVLVARILQSTIHIAATPTNTIVLVRFIFYLLQVICFFGMAGVIVNQAL
ncbi:MAG: MAPEG family protein [Cycloclasticus sp.]|nr:MAPEG family protein [Cycloclasticus sp.]